MLNPIKLAYDLGPQVGCMASLAVAAGASLNYHSKFFELKMNELKTRMVQLPATAAIEYVAACWVSGGAFVRGVFCPGGLLSGGLMPIPPKFNVYTHHLGFLCLAS